MKKLSNEFEVLNANQLVANYCTVELRPLTETAKKYLEQRTTPITVREWESGFSEEYFMFAAKQHPEEVDLHPSEIDKYIRFERVGDVLCQHRHGSNDPWEKYNLYRIPEKAKPLLGDGQRIRLGKLINLAK